MASPARRRARWLAAATVFAFVVGLVAGMTGGEDALPPPAPTPTTVPPTATVTPTPTPDDVELRRGALLGATVELRSEPRSDAEVVAVVDDAEGDSVSVESPLTDAGWYRVSTFVGGSTVRGWMFGAYLVPADSGRLVVEHVDGGAITLYRDEGSDAGLTVDGEVSEGELGNLPEVNPTDPFALVLDTLGERWPIRLPDGTTAWIDPGEVRPRT